MPRHLWSSREESAICSLIRCLIGFMRNRSAADADTSIQTGTHSWPKRWRCHSHLPFQQIISELYIHLMLSNLQKRLQGDSVLLCWSRFVFGHRFSFEVMLGGGREADGRCPVHLLTKYLSIARLIGISSRAHPFGRYPSSNERIWWTLIRIVEFLERHMLQLMIHKTHEVSLLRAA